MLFALKTCYCCPRSCISVLGEMVSKFSLLFLELLKENKVYQGLQMEGPKRQKLLVKVTHRKL